MVAGSSSALTSSETAPVLFRYTHVGYVRFVDIAVNLAVSAHFCTCRGYACDTACQEIAAILQDNELDQMPDWIRPPQSNNLVPERSTLKCQSGCQKQCC